MTGVGMPAFLDRVANGLGNTAPPQAVPWGLWVAAYTFFSGIAAGAFVVAALPHVFNLRRFRPLVPLALVVSGVSLASAMIFIMADLGHPERALHIMLNPNTGSVMAWVIGLYGAFGAVLVVMLWYVLRPLWAKQAMRTGARLPRLLAMGYRASPQREVKDDRTLRVIGIVGVVFALCLGAGVGALFSVLPGRGLWHSGLFPITFLVSALLSGAAAVLAAATLMGRGGNAFKDTLLYLGNFIGILLAIECLILPAEALIIVNGAIPSHVNVLHAIATQGPFPWVFWGCQIGVGTFIPLLLLRLPRRPTLASAAVAALFALIGVFAFRLNFVLPQLAVSDFALSSAGGVYFVPHMLEWNFVVFGFGVAGLIFLLASWILPVLPKEAALHFELATRHPESIFPTPLPSRN
jgi:molybdopterin-containing oxidoreductase family membrane subunit